MQVKSLIVSCLLLLSFGCANFPAIVHVRELNDRKQSFRIMGDSIGAEKIIIIRDALQRLNPQMVVPGIIFHIRDEEGHFDKTWTGNESVGHVSCRKDAFPKICIKSFWVVQSLVWHETAHIYQDFLDKCGSSFTKEWRKVAGGAYTRISGTRPVVRDGLLTDYSRGDAYEDVADWVDELHSFLEGNSLSTWQNEPVLKTDLRYRKKLKLLYEYRWLSEENYRKLKPLFE